jgi:hypothetical protein
VAGRKEPRLGSARLLTGTQEDAAGRVGEGLSRGWRRDRGVGLGVGEYMVMQGPDACCVVKTSSATVALGHPL